MYQLRPYQQLAVSTAMESLKGKKNGIIVMPTGSGKSLVIASIAQQSGGKTIILQPTREILSQNKAKMEAFGMDNIGVYSASVGRKDVGDITFATIGSVIKHRELFESFDRIIVDENHLVNSKGGMYEEFINGLGLQTIGLTATPYRMRNYRDYRTGDVIAESRILTRTRPRIFSKFLHITQVKDLFEAGFLCPLDYSWQNDYDSRQVKSTSTGQGFDDNALERYNQKKGIADKIVAEVADTGSRHCLAFTQFRSESAKVIEGLTELGISCAEVSGETKKKDRENIIRAFMSGQIKCVVNVGVFTVGFDFPELDCIIIGRPTKSVGLYYQIVGRGVRTAPGKENCKLIDLCDNVKRFGRIESFEIVDQNGNDMWRLRSDVGNITGVDVVTGRDLESVKAGASKKDKQKAENGSLKINFGKFEGKAIAEVNTEYLVWCVKNFKGGRWKCIFGRELKRRKSQKAPEMAEIDTPW
ncbi:MAG: DEAD/DEAH box helicase [candidate division Zixibacteria bacterium]|nr:DEAD/DEAH box helicase [candidate division Zixibacteria bacterium]